MFLRELAYVLQSEARQIAIHDEDGGGSNRFLAHGFRSQIGEDGHICNRCHKVSVFVVERQVLCRGYPVDDSNALAIEHWDGVAVRQERAAGFIIANDRVQ